MVNKEYIKGRKKEYKIKKDYENMGYIVLRTAGSHGFADLIAVDKLSKEIVFIQAKGEKEKESEKKKLYREHEWLNDEFKCSFEVV